MLAPVLLLVCLALLASLLLNWLQQRYRTNPEPLLEAINRVLPQTQCGQCGYPGCRPYAQALLDETTPLDLCPPGGQETLLGLQKLLGRDSATHFQKPVPQVAWIDEGRCIGCALCLPACPVDAIVGAQGYMHSILIDDCTGCALCIDPCPMDCIHLRSRKGWETEALGSGTQWIFPTPKPAEGPAEGPDEHPRH